MSMPVGQTCTQRRQSTQSPAPAAPFFSARLAAPRIVADDERVAVDERGLQAAIRTEDDAKLLAKPREVEPQRAGDEEDEKERRRVFAGRVRHHRVEARERDEIREQHMREEQLSPGRGVALAQAVDAARDVEEDGLRAGPAAPHAAEQRGEVEKAEADSAQDEEGDPHILAEKGGAEVVELPVRDIEEKRGMAIDANPRERDVDRGEGDGEERAPFGETAPHFRRMDEAARAVVVDRRDEIERWA